ncbi:protein kinase domain-containing protein [Gemmata obscuriglobus]|uniref:protein kinase domain-containing protein n=1 Tax=Gemmata obscuriglobus TaxID=114 RepID=UPI0021BBC136|nr:protein kinase [Gemmata obscuriglobus]
MSPEELVDLRRRNRPAFHQTVARIGGLVARALDHAHQNGVVHRDIKPANLLLGRDGHIWVTDFGLAQFTDAATVTGTGTAIGTLRYMSPEQAEGDRRRLDHRADVYSLAATLYELSTGRPAFPAETPAALLLQIARGAPPAPRSVDPTVPRDLEAVLLKGLETDPRDRYATAAEFADDLDRFLNRRPIAARRPCAGDRARKWAGRHPAVVAGAAIALVLLTAGSGAIAALNQRAYRAERDRADEAERRFYQSKQLGDLMIQISEEEGRSNVSFHGPRRRLLLAALENYRQLNEAGHNDPQVRAELDRATARVEELLAEEKAARESWRVGLLWFQPVRAELRLSPDQEEQVRQSFRVRGLEPGTATAGLGTIRDDLNLRGKIARLLSDPTARNELLRPLTGPQRKRLGELFLRCLGPMAFGDPEIVEALGLTPHQRQQIRLLQPPVALRLGPPFAVLLDDRRPGGIDPASDPVTLLTSEQRAIWKALIGRPFEMPW